MMLKYHLSTHFESVAFMYHAHLKWGIQFMWMMVRKTSFDTMEVGIYIFLPNMSWLVKGHCTSVMITSSITVMSN